MCTEVRLARENITSQKFDEKNCSLFCLTRYCSKPKNSTQSATSSIFQVRQEGVPSESKVGSNPLSNFVGVFLELFTSPSAIFVYRGNSTAIPQVSAVWQFKVPGLGLRACWKTRMSRREISPCEQRLCSQGGEI